MADDLKDKAADMMKKVLTVGVGTLFLTEETLRSMVSEFKLPKELIGGVLESANKTKNEFFQKLSSDVLDRIKDKVDPQALVQEFLSKNEIELNIRINFKPKEESASASSKPARASKARAASNASESSDSSEAYHQVREVGPSSED